MIYLDNNATTSIDPRVLDVVIEEFKRSPANPSSVHAFGRSARQRLNAARRQIASVLGVKEGELTFTSGATESLNTLLVPGNHLITSSIEHPCVLAAAKRSSSVTYLPCGLSGAVSPDDLEAAIRPDTHLIALSAANSETGVKNPIEEIAKIALRRGIPLVVDAVALFGKEPLIIYPGITALVVSSHKIHGPAGIGLTWAKAPFQPLLLGGGQESGRRSGTENLPAILGFAKAVELLTQELPAATLRMRELRDHLERSLQEAFPSILINGQGPRVANTSNIAFEGCDGEALLMRCDQAGIAVSLGSACASGALEPSHVLRAMGIPLELARSSIRFSLSRMTTREEIDRVIEIVSSSSSVIF